LCVYTVTNIKLTRKTKDIMVKSERVLSVLEWRSRRTLSPFE